MTADRPLGFGIMGCGAISETHARAIGQVEGARVVAACSRMPGKAATFAGAFGCDPVPDLEALLGRPDVDVVVIGTPSGQHAEQGIAAARAGKHVVVEKPVDVSLAKADALIAACREAGVLLSVVSQFRFLAAVVRTKEAFAQGRFGTPTLGSAYIKWYRPQSYYDSAAWRGTWAQDGGGCLMNQGIHAIDQLLHLFGPVERVQGVCATLAHAIEVEDAAVASLKFANGAVGHVVGSTAAFPGQAARLELHGSDGSVCFDLGGAIRVREFRDEKGDPGVWGRTVRETDPAAVRVEGAADPRAISVENHRRQFADVADAIRTRRPPAVTGEEGRRAIALILAIYESARTGREVVLGD